MACGGRESELPSLWYRPYQAVGAEVPVRTHWIRGFTALERPGSGVS